MKKIHLFLLVAFAIVLSIRVNGQLLSFTFNSSPFESPSFVSPNLIVSDFQLSAGTWSTNVTTGTYFTDEPYLEESGGWAETSFASGKYAFVELIPTVGNEVFISEVSFEVYVTSAGPSAIGIMIGEDSIFSASLDDSQLTSMSVPINKMYSSGTVIRIIGWDDGSRSTSGGGAFRIDNLEIQGSVNALPENDTNSVIGIVSFNVPTYLNSVDTSFPGFEVLKFFVTDSATFDGLPTLIDSLLIEQSAVNTIGDWKELLQSASLFSSNSDTLYKGFVYENSLQFIFENSLVVDEGLGFSDTLSLFIQLAESSKFIDHSAFGFSLDSAHIYCNSSGSQISYGMAESDPSALNINVEASRFALNKLDSILPINTPFSIDALAIDNFGNLDLDYNDDYTLLFQSINNSGKVNIHKTGQFSAGKMQLNDLNIPFSDTLNLELTAEGLQTFRDTLISALFLFNDMAESLSQWQDTLHWIKQDGNIQHGLIDTAGASYLSGKYINTGFNEGYTIWTFNLANGDFDPSSSNKFGYYLMTNTPKLLADSIYGYNIGVNLSGSSDTLALYRIDKDGSINTLINTTLNWEANTSASIEIRRDALGSWSVVYDTTQNRIKPILSETIKDNTFSNLSNHGLMFSYTESRAGKLSLSEYKAFRINTAPKILLASVIDDSFIEVLFNEKVSGESLGEFDNYSLQDENGKIFSISDISVANDSLAVFLYPESLEESDYSLKINELADLEGKVRLNETITFTYLKGVQAYSLVINEILFDNYPEQGLPRHDFLELYNVSTDTLNLNAWKLEIGGSEYTITSKSIAPNDYLILCSSDAQNEYQTYGETLGILPSNALTNTGKPIVLYSDKGRLIDSVYYQANWIAENEKSNGGWSLERIDPMNTCGQASNWAASVSTTGGTPGSINSIFRNNIDDTAPYVIKSIPIGTTKLLLHFSEEVNLINRELSESFYLNDNSVDSVKIVEPSQLELIPAKAMESTKAYSLKVSGITDPCGNIIEDTSLNFVYYEPQLFDVVISEVMEDASPSIGLPEEEYIELYNASEFGICIYNWKLKVGTSEKNIQEGYLEPGAYSIVCNDTLAFSNYGNVLYSEDALSLPGTAWLGLYNQQDKLISSSNYSSLYITDEFKQEGGFSLERIDINNLLDLEDNWQASQHTQGGTPGQANSVSRENPDLLEFNLINALPLTTTELLLLFDKPISTAGISMEQFEVDRGIGKPVNYHQDETDLYRLKLKFKEAFAGNNRYEITLDNSIKDISGNFIELNTFTFSMPGTLEPKEILINEVLFNPFAGGVDFVELYNNSSKALNLSNVILSSRDAEGNLKSPQNISQKGFLLMPGDYVFISENNELIVDFYWAPHHAHKIELNNLPSFPNDEGGVVILDTTGLVIDEFSYHEEMHFDLLSSNEGVSLERINFDNETQNPNHWHSAAQSAGWATPGYENSMYSEYNVAKELLEIEPKTFSPDGDGYHDMLQIKYALNSPGYVADLSIYDDEGRIVRQLCKNELLETEGLFTWDGLNDNGEQVTIGIYIVLFEYFNLAGETGQEQKTCVLSVKF